MEQKHIYLAIDLKSFYASVECADRYLDPLETNLVVADVERTDKTICLAVSPSLKAYGIPGRARLFEVRQKVKEINKERQKAIHYEKFRGSSFDERTLSKDPYLKLDFIPATPRMALYMKTSAKIYSIYLKYIAPEDIHVYSVDEVFIDATKYLNTYKMTPYQLCRKLIQEVYKETRITATGGIGTNLYLAKVAMDITAKHMKPDEDGVRIAELDEMTYRKKLWCHKPLTDFWRVGKGLAKKLQTYHMETMGDIARTALKNQELLYKLFGVNAEYLIDHAFGYEPTTIADIKAYKPQNSSLSVGQVLHCPYDFEKTKLVLREMATELSYELMEQDLVTDEIVVSVGYDIDNLKDDAYHGEIKEDYLGRKMPSPVHGSMRLNHFTCLEKYIVDATLKITEQIIDPSLLTRRMFVVAIHTIRKKDAPVSTGHQMSMFMNPELEAKKIMKSQIEDEKDLSLQETLLNIKKRYGKNSVLKGFNYEEGATQRERNVQIGGHKA